MKQLAALRALRLNYRRRGVVRWLRGTHRLAMLRGDWYSRASTGGYKVSGWVLVLRYPDAVTAEQHAIADGAVL